MQVNMQHFLNTRILDNQVREYLLLIGVLLIVYIFKNYLSRYIASLAYGIIKKWTPGVAKKDFAQLLLKPLGLFLMLMAFLLLIDRLHFPPRLNINIYKTSLYDITDALVQIVLIISVTWIILRLIDFTAMVMSQKAELNATPSNNQLILFFRDFIKVIVSLLAFTVMLRYMIGESFVNKMVAALGIGAAALALAAKDSIQNLIGSFIILFDKPFHIGDIVKVNTVSGVVEKIGLRSTRIRTDAKTYVTIPNNLMVDNVLDNITMMSQRRVGIDLELHAGTASATVETIIKEIRTLLANDKNVLAGYTVNLNDIARESYVVQIIYYTSVTEWQPYNELRQQIALAIIRLLESHEVQLAKRIDVGL
jgi:MscS family membrane protein